MNTVRFVTADFKRAPLRGWDESFRLVDELYSEFQALGIATLGSSRIRAYRDAFLALKAASEQKDRLQQGAAEKILQTLVEFQRLRTIIKAVRSSAQRGVWQERLRPLVSGSAFPAQESDSSPARDYQFESYIAAVSELSGYRITFDEPDVIVEGGGHRFGIAAKRPRSSRAIKKNCRKAVHQIEVSGIPGMVALDLSTALYSNACINANDMAGVALFVETAANRFLADNYEGLKSLCHENLVFAVLVSVQLPALSFGHPLGTQVITGTRWAAAPMCDSLDDRRSWIFEFVRKCELGLFGPRLPDEQIGDSA
jgi:hypothetical protein